MAPEGGRIDFMFLGPFPTRPVDPLLFRKTDRIANTAVTMATFKVQHWDDHFTRVHLEGREVSSSICCLCVCHCACNAGASLIVK